MTPHHADTRCCVSGLPAWASTPNALPGPAEAHRKVPLHTWGLIPKPTRRGHSCLEVCVSQEPLGAALGSLFLFLAQSRF